MRLSKERKELLGSFANKAIGAAESVKIADLVGEFNSSMEKPATIEEMLHGLRRYIATMPKKDILF